MIRWCCYCQHMMGEAEPLDSYDITHGICEPCFARLAAGEDLLAEYDAAIRLYREIYAAARVGDVRSCAELANRAAHTGLHSADVLVGLLQPALFEIGRRWERGEVTVDDEHRFTSWCDEMMATVAPSRPLSGELDLLIFQAPGDLHDVGPRMAERVLRDRGVRAEAVVLELGADAILSIAAARRPRWIGFSCALPDSVTAALGRVDDLRARGFEGRVILSGQAVRRSAETVSGVSVCRTVDEAAALIRQGRGVRSG